ncbi:F-box/RNI-like superfamily protein [Rhynchospora pubera]|uniref:F-box/RNI-like superfamily protein n=1 Tax=Rhynchospora pubera TaxID=906938 RepID=A0AAV8BYJ7_9POAL|nr:F-box/RNI-like superfamily protein [Rhynchospora pubera]
MFPFQVSNFCKGKMNSSLIILTVVPAMSFLLCKHMLVAFSSYFKINKNNLSTTSSLSREKDISDDTTCNIPECIKLKSSGVDNICELSDCIKHKILLYLPIKEAARTSILSKSWQHTWSTIPNLVVDCNKSSNSPQNNDNAEKSRIEKLVDQLFGCHKGNLYKFKLSGTKLITFLPTRWMKILSKKQISELILEPNTDKFLYMIGDGFSCCLNLKVLVLSKCFVFLPSNQCDGFKLLHTIDLRDCVIHEMRITGLLSLCPLLEKLTVKPSCFDQSININAPKLRELIIYGDFTRVSLVTPNLCIANFITPQTITKATPRTVGLRGDLIKLPVHIYGLSFDIQEKDASSSSTFSYLFRNYPPTLNNLLNIGMVMILAPEEHYIAHEVFRELSRLENLILYLEPIGPSYVSKVNKVQDGIFPCLRQATIIPFSSSETVLEFAEMILTNAPLLERITIKGEMRSCDAFKLNEICKLSTIAEIIFSKSCFCVNGKHQCCCCPECEVVAW